MRTIRLAEWKLFFSDTTVEMRVFGFDDKTKEMYLKSLFPGVTVDEIKVQVGWDLKVSPDLDVVELEKEFDAIGDEMAEPWK